MSGGFKGRANAYTCETCGDVMITRDVDEGTTPMFTRCKVEGCTGLAASGFYRIQEPAVETHEWYRPTSTANMNDATRQHVSMGGLILRPKGAAS